MEILSKLLCTVERFERGLSAGLCRCSRGRKLISVITSTKKILQRLFPGTKVYEKAELWDRVMDKGIIVIPEEGAVLLVNDQEWRLVHKIRIADSQNLKALAEALADKEGEARKQHNKKAAEFLADISGVLLKMRPSLLG